MSLKEVIEQNSDNMLGLFLSEMSFYYYNNNLTEITPYYVFNYIEKFIKNHNKINAFCGLVLKNFDIIMFNLDEVYGSNNDEIILEGNNIFTIVINEDGVPSREKRHREFFLASDIAMFTIDGYTVFLNEENTDVDNVFKLASKYFSYQHKKNINEMITNQTLLRIYTANKEKIYRGG